MGTYNKNDLSYTYSKDHPEIIKAGELSRAKEDQKFNQAKEIKHIYAIQQDFYDFIGHQKNYTKEYFIELREKHQGSTPIFHVVDKEFPENRQYEFSILGIRPMSRYCAITIDVNIEDSFQGRYELKVKYVDYFKMKKEINAKLFAIIQDLDVPNNYIKNDSRKDIWSFDFSKINFLQK
jgi:hypothetical protein